LAAFNRAWNTHHVIPEFRVGTDFRSDFLILSAHSGAWIATFIELESHRVGLYRRDGVKTRSLSVAERQIAEWKHYVKRFESVMRHQLAAVLRRKRECAWCSVGERFKSGADEITSPDTSVYYYYHVVIGRSSSLTEEEREYRAQDMSWGGDVIATYDRFLAFARRWDQAESETRRARRVERVKAGKNREGKTGTDPNSRM
jgi:hypothetical protein